MKLNELAKIYGDSFRNVVVLRVAVNKDKRIVLPPSTYTLSEVEDDEREGTFVDCIEDTIYFVLEG